MNNTMKQLERIQHMESCLNDAQAAVERMNDALDQFEAAQAKLKELDTYLSSDDWKQDFADDEAGRLPKDLQRGVLSEDAIWNTLDDSRQLLVRMLQTVADRLTR